MSGNLTKQIGDAMIARLTLSYQTNMNTVAAAYGIQPEAVTFTVGNGQFYRGMFDIADLESTVTTLTYPIVMIYNTGAQNLRRTKPAMFSGDVEMGMDFIHAWPITDGEGGFAMSDYESILDATFETLVNVFNTGVTFPQPISYGGILNEAGRSPRQLSNREQEYTRRQRFQFGFYTRM